MRVLKRVDTFLFLIYNLLIIKFLYYPLKGNYIFYITFLHYIVLMNISTRLFEQNFKSIALMNKSVILLFPIYLFKKKFGCVLNITQRQFLVPVMVNQWFPKLCFAYNLEGYIYLAYPTCSFF